MQSLIISDICGQLDSADCNSLFFKSLGKDIYACLIVFQSLFFLIFCMVTKDGDSYPDKDNEYFANVYTKGSFSSYTQNNRAGLI